MSRDYQHQIQFQLLDIVLKVNCTGLNVLPSPWPGEPFCISLHCQRLCSHLIAHTYCSSLPAIINHVCSICVHFSTSTLHQQFGYAKAIGTIICVTLEQKKFQILSIWRGKCKYLHILWWQLQRQFVGWKLEGFGRMNWSQVRFCGFNTWSHKGSEKTSAWKELRVYFLTIRITVH